MGDRVLVIGGSRKTGLLIGRLLAERGDDVRILARDVAATAARVGSAPRIEILRGDLTKPETLGPAVRGMDHIIFTAGVHSGRYAPEALVKATDHDGVMHTLAAAREEKFHGRFVYLNAIGVTRRSFGAFIINTLKRNTLVWRRRVEGEIRASGFDYTIIRVGFLIDRPAGEREIKISQRDLPLSPFKTQIGRSDTAEAFVTAMRHPKASRATFDILWGRGARTQNWAELMNGLAPDS